MKPSCPEGCSPSKHSRGESSPCFFQLLMAVALPQCSLPCARITSVSACMIILPLLFVWLLSVFLSQNFCLFLIRIHMIALMIRLDNPFLKMVNHIFCHIRYYSLALGVRM